MDYLIADSMLGNRETKKLDNNTYLVRRANSIDVRLHDTYIVSYHPNGDVTLNSGSWHTNVTKDRISRFSPYSIRQERKIWFVTIKGQELPFVDRMVIKAAPAKKGAAA